MSEAIEDLKHEHEAILFVLAVMEKVNILIEEERLDDTTVPLQLISFLKEFVDTCHHGKEENILFAELEEAGVGKERGPLGMLIGEHRSAREYTAAMEEAVAVRNDLKDFAGWSWKYVTLIRKHIREENEMLFPMAETALDAETLTIIGTRFDRFEEEVIGEGRHRELHALLDRLVKRYLD